MAIDYETFPLSRENLRFFAKIIRKKLHIRTTKIPVIKLLDILEEEYGVMLSIEADEEYEKNLMAYLNKQGYKYVIHIRNSVYEKACEGDKTSIGFICHEMCHYFLIEWFGYSPIYGRTLGEKKIDLFRSMEWQAKALCGELMIPYEKFLQAGVNKIMKLTDSSYSQAMYYIKSVRHS